MTNLKVIGKENVAGYEFTGIEGGFEKGKRGMLVRDIAEIHGQRVAKINERIQSNIKRFKNGVDLIDLKNNDFLVPLKDIGFTQNQVNRSLHVYMLSERGYAKLLKILEDDTAWDIYDQFVDGYFNMRQQFKKPQSAMELIKLQNDAMIEVDERVSDLEDFKKDYDENRQIDEEQVIKLEKARKRRAMQLVGGKDTQAYKEFYSIILRNKMYPDFRNKFNVNRYRSLKIKYFDQALKFLESWEPKKETKYAIEYANQMELNLENEAV